METTMKPRTFHLWDFPDDVIRIVLRRKVTDGFFDDCIRHFGSIRAYSQYLSVPKGMVYSWRKDNLFIPLWAIRKTITEISWTWKFIEENTVAYKSASTGNPITSPVLPIKETPELYELIGHLICDGHVSKSGIPGYTNITPELIENIKELLSKIFGNVHGNLVRAHSSDKCFHYYFSKTVYDIIHHFYGIEFGSLTASLPNEVFDLPESFGRSMIRAVVDDEGTVRDNRIPVMMKNKQLLTQLRKLLVNMLGEDSVSVPYMTTENRWVLAVKSRGMREFMKKVKLVHPRKGQDLEYAVKKTRRTGQCDPPWDTKIRILKLLKKGSLTTKQISWGVSINTNNAASHLRELLSKSLVKRIRSKHTFSWKLSDEGLRFLNTREIGKGSIKVELPDWEEMLGFLGKDILILLAPAGRERIFWMLRRALKTQDNIGKQFNVHRNSASNWKRGASSIRLSTLNEMLVFFGNSGIDLTDEIANSIEDVRYLNGTCINNRR